MSDREILELILEKVTAVDQKVDRLEKRVESLERRVESLEKRMDLLEARVERLELQVAENTQILKALEHLAQVNKAEHDNFTHQLARIEGLLSSEISKNKEEHQLLFVKTEENSEKITRLEKDMVVIESVCGKNMQDIAFLKGVKN
ncbi:Nucleopolyhedrovirus P10 family protein [Caldicellulosiruptor acetigenus I77R1B]|uniref:Nucleopolyhedrovirus P10 family protein n=2 Tax=Caldicellulosiruptor acetigenus TaxID=301953 RepID=G2PV60_9FIRM|nr:nucleopolyhedrovirus p10 family protein [Caldicellulosiruptor acetigenus]ADQ41846.1 Nucleopolyhedrovirus P10 family protein [Caldicellulosiruptor acetigenus I77R1B]AEM72751.1 Nucleopolyhedrovirus P10 family protein [Caldicellulosiruptor acetigenus 6A]